MKSTYRRQYEQFLARLKRARKEAGITQRELAKRLRRPQSFVSKYENAERRLDVVEFLQVTQALGVNACDLLEGLSDASELQTRLRPKRAGRLSHRSG